MKGYIIATKKTECYGHGEFVEEITIRKNFFDLFPPVFLEKEKAEKYLNSLEHKAHKTVEEIDIIQ